MRLFRNIAVATILLGIFGADATAQVAPAAVPLTPRAARRLARQNYRASYVVMKPRRPRYRYRTAYRVRTPYYGTVVAPVVPR
ncbi:MAG TPA: hypothetical protein VGZ22_04570 [Isosphaeraceae bacterium]|jgi:hypothetical protein|nr:hypothetical protein [Isosphaeraceae bacterium]